VRESGPGAQGGTVSTIGALDLRGFQTGLRVPGAIEGETLVFFIEELLAPTLKQGDVVFMDNYPIHKMEAREDVIEARGAGGRLLPPYSSFVVSLSSRFSLLEHSFTPDQRH
jgi:hypothetical protein